MSKQRLTLIYTVVTGLIIHLVLSANLLAMAKPLPYLDKQHLKDVDRPLVILDFYSQYCGTCIKLDPYYVMIKKKFKDDVTFKRININRISGSKLGDLYEVDGTPTYILFDGNTGKPIYRMKDVIAITTLQRQLSRFSNQLEEWGDEPLLKPHINTNKDGYSLVAFRKFHPCNGSCQKAQGAVNSMSYAMDGQMPGYFLDAGDEKSVNSCANWALSETVPMCCLITGAVFFTPNKEGCIKKVCGKSIKMMTDMSVE